MITAVMFRHGIEDATAKRRIAQRLQGLEKRSGIIRRVQVVLDRIAYGGSPACNYQCHISLRGRNKTALDIYADKRQPDMAIDDAFDRVHMALDSKTFVRRLRKKR